MNYLAAIDLEVFVWGILAFIWVIAQIAGQFSKSKKPEGEEGQNRKNMPGELREFLEGIERQAKGEQQTTPQQRPAPQPVQTQQSAPQPVYRKPKPVESPRNSSKRNMGKAAASSAKSVGQAKLKVNRQTERIVEALEERKRKFNKHSTRQTDHVQKVLGNRFKKTSSRQGVSAIKGPSRRDEHESISNIGIQGFKLPSLTLPATADLVRRDIKNSIRFSTAGDARRALIEALVIAPAVANQPPGSTELNKPKK